jgi:hypothetical protein
MMFGDGTPEGTLPVEIPEIVVNEDGSIHYSDDILEERGFGLEFFGTEEPTEKEAA